MRLFQGEVTSHSSFGFLIFISATSNSVESLGYAVIHVFNLTEARVTLETGDGYARG